MNLEGDMCSKCVYMDLNDKNKILCATEFRCTKKGNYYPWDDKPGSCSKYSPDYSDTRKRRIYDSVD